MIRLRLIRPALLLLQLALLPVLSRGQGPVEVIQSAPWAESTVTSGVVLRQHHFASLYGSQQDVFYVEADLDNPALTVRLLTLPSGSRAAPSAFAGATPGAVAVVNGNFFNTTTFVPTQFVKVDGEVFTATNNGIGGIAIGADEKVTLHARPGAGWASLPHPHVMATNFPIIIGGARYPWTVNDNTKPRHPRTVIARKPDGDILLILVDGRSSRAAGMSFEELTTLTLALGAVDAINMDGGGSSALWAHGAGVVNNPSDGSERRVPTAIALLGPPDRLDGEAIIIESRSGGKNFGWYSESGVWANSGAASGAPGTTLALGQRYGSTYRQNAGYKAAQFTPVIARPGRYAVAATWGAGTTRQYPITFRVRHMLGEEKILIDQRATANAWVELGTYEFGPGDSGFVEINNGDIDASGNMYIAAVRFVRLAESPAGHWAIYD